MTEPGGSLPPFLLDQGLPRDTAGLLRRQGWECSHVGELGYAAAQDEEILALAIERRSAVLTLDADFHTILAVTGARGPSVVRIRIEGLKAEEMGQMLVRVLPRFAEQLQQGALVTIKRHRVTCRALPIGQA